MSRNIDIYGTSGLTLTPFWRPRAPKHRYLRWISAWAKIRYGIMREESRPPSPPLEFSPQSKINSLLSYKPSRESLPVPITNVQLETNVSIASRNPLRPNRAAIPSSWRGSRTPRDLRGPLFPKMGAPPRREHDFRNLYQQEREASY